eukprot:623772-Rhodomonas_salina.2
MVLEGRELGTRGIRVGYCTLCEPLVRPPHYPGNIVGMDGVPMEHVQRVLRYLLGTILRVHEAAQ